MSEMRLVSQGRSEDGFVSLLEELEDNLNQARTKEERDELVANIDQLLQATRLSPEERRQLTLLHYRTLTQHTVPPKQATQPSFWEGICKAFSSIDGEKFARKTPAVLLSTVATTFVAGFVWFQSISLYKSNGFSQPEVVASGAIIMMIGFAALYARTHSKLALLFCIYACGYEAFFMISGTVQDEKLSRTQVSETNSEVVWLKAQAEKTKQDYQQAKERYETPESKTFQNGWFKAKFVDPAWVAYAAAEKELQEKSQLLQSDAGSWHVTWLKVFYRLGLVFLCMMLVHRFFIFTFIQKTDSKNPVV